MGLNFAKIIDFDVAKNRFSSIVDDVTKEALSPYKRLVKQPNKSNYNIITEERYKQFKKLFKIIKNLNDKAKKPATDTLDDLIANVFKVAYVKKGKLVTAT